MRPAPRFSVQLVRDFGACLDRCGEIFGVHVPLSSRHRPPGSPLRAAPVVSCSPGAGSAFASRQIDAAAAARTAAGSG